MAHGGHDVRWSGNIPIALLQCCCRRVAKRIHHDGVRLIGTPAGHLSRPGIVALPRRRETAFRCETAVRRREHNSGAQRAIRIAADRNGRRPRPRRTVPRGFKGACRDARWRSRHKGGAQIAAHPPATPDAARRALHLPKISVGVVGRRGSETVVQCRGVSAIGLREHRAAAHSEHSEMVKEGLGGWSGAATEREEG